MRKKKKFNYQYKKEHGIYLVMGLIIAFLSLFLVNNFGRCKIYSLSTTSNTYKFGNGVLVLSNQKNTLKLNNIEYAGNIENIISVELTLCVDVEGKCNSIWYMSSNSAEGMNLGQYLEKVSFDINEDSDTLKIFTKDVRKNITKKFLLQVEIVTLEGEQIYDLVPIDVDLQYNNNKLFY